MQLFKKNILFVFVLLTIITLFVGCSKNQRINKQIDGKWKVISIDGYPTSANELFYDFVSGKRGMGMVTSTVKYLPPLPYGIDSLTTKYTIDEKGTRLQMGSGSPYTIYRISKTHLTLLNTDPSNMGSVEMEKQ